MNEPGVMAVQVPSNDAAWYWLAYYPDWSGFAVFGAAEETICLRHAVKHHMEVAHVPFGADPRDYL